MIYFNNSLFYNSILTLFYNSTSILTESVLELQNFYTKVLKYWELMFKDLSLNDFVVPNIITIWSFVFLMLLIFLFTKNYNNSTSTSLNLIINKSASLFILILINFLLIIFLLNSNNLFILYKTFIFFIVFIILFNLYTYSNNNTQTILFLSLPITEQNNNNDWTWLVINFIKNITNNDIILFKVGCYLFAVIISILFYIIAFPVVSLLKTAIVVQVEKKYFYTDLYKKYYSFSEDEKKQYHKEFDKKNPPEDFETMILKDDSKFFNLYLWLFAFLSSYAAIWFIKIYFINTNNTFIYLTVVVLITMSLYMYKIHKFDEIKSLSDIHWKVVIIHVIYFFLIFIMWYSLYYIIVINFLISIHVWPIVFISKSQVFFSVFMIRVIFVLTLTDYNMTMAKNNSIFTYLCIQPFINKVFASDIALVIIAIILFLINPDFFIYFFIAMIYWQMIPKKILILILKIRAYLQKRKINKKYN